MKRPENIESLLIDYAEGVLKPEDLPIVEAWLEEHPEDLELVMEWDELKLEAEDSNTSESFEHLLVDEALEEELFLELEGELEQESQERLQKAIETSAPLERERKLFQLTKLDYERDRINYPAKEELKKRSVVPLFKTSWIQYAAAAIFVGFLIWFSTGDEIDPQYAMRDSKQFPSILQLSKEQLDLPNLPSVAQKELFANNNAQEDKTAYSAPLKQSTERKKEKLETLKARDSDMRFNEGNEALNLAERSFDEGIKQNQSLGLKDSKTRRFDSFLSYARHLVIKRFSPGLEDKSNSEVLAGNLERLSDGKLSVKIEQGKLLAVQTPLVDWKRSIQ